MVWMAPDRVGKNDDPGFCSTYHLDDLFSRRFIVLQVYIRHGGVQPQCDAERRGRALGLRGARGGITARSHFALREVQNSHAMTGLRGLGERAAARELDVIAVRGDREQVNGLTVIHSEAPPPDPASPLALPSGSLTTGRPGSRQRWQSPRAPRESSC